MAGRIATILFIVMIPSLACGQTLTSTATVYREAYLEWRGLAQHRLEKNDRLMKINEECAAQREQWKTIATLPKEEKSEGPPPWVGTMTTVGIIVSFGIGVWFGVKVAK